MQVIDVETPSGLARAHLGDRVDTADPIGLVVLGHGAGGGIDAPDLVAVSAELTVAGWAVTRVEQPYRVAGRRAPVPAPRLDAAFSAVVAAVRARFPRGPLILGGRSSGARVACRTAGDTGADGVLALAFPLHPPAHPDRSRAGELAGVRVPVLVVQGERDSFGAPAAFTLAGLPDSVEVIGVPGDHSLRRGPDRLGAIVTAWAAGIAARGDALEGL
jgi:predicted alpha/beta-hydrolase family hydrolase